MKWVALNGLALAALALFLTVNWWIALNNMGLWPVAIVAASIGLGCTAVGLYVALEAWIASRHG